MPNVTQLPIISTATSQTFFMVVDNKITKRLNYQSLPSSFLGYSGSQGLQGIIGATGYAGSAGVAGPSGPDGVPGPRGFEGYTGSLGSLGYTGSVGAGYAGSRGYTGSSGAGYAGSLGNTGYSGSIGAQGPAGGYTGSAGVPGPSGIQGDPGGYTGSKGDAGYTGSAPRDGYTGSIGGFGYTGSQGLAGVNGTIGSRGYTGSLGLGERGYTGSMTVGYTGSAGGGGGGVGLSSRTTVNVTTGVVAPGATVQVSLTGYKTYVLSRVVTSIPSWVRLYVSPASQIADISRTVGNDPLPGSGVIAEVITTTGFLTQPITPGVIGFNGETVPNSNIFLNVTNTSGVSQTVTISLTLLQLET